MKNETNRMEFTWDPEIGEATCVITDKKENVFIGVAQCHEADRDFMSEKTGCFIAQERAGLQALRFYRDNEAKPALRVLEHLYSNMRTSKNFNPKSYEAKMLRRQIAVQKDTVTMFNDMIRQSHDYLRQYMSDKEKFYSDTRKHRRTAELEKANSN